MDVYPDIAVEVGVLGKDALPTRALRAIANWSRQYADTVIALGDDMRDLLLRADLDRTKVLVAENWSDSVEIQPGPFPQGRLEVLYAGNLGLAHDVSTVQGAMISCSDAENFRFTFRGGGIHRTALEDFVDKHRLANVSFRGPYRDNQRYEMFSACHVGLVTQNENVAGSMVPSKIYGILAAGRPVLYVGPNNTTAAKIVESHDCGWRVAPGDVNGLVKLLHTLNTNRELIYSAGGRARQALLEHYDRSIAMSKLAPLIVR
jgi:glycosyltransferase involved in cell wall biosynthesis